MNRETRAIRPSLSMAESSKGVKNRSWLSRHYLAVINALVFLYISGAILAPILMKMGLPQIAALFYKFYSPFCHQLAFRSFFLFGQQGVYPHQLAGLSVISFGQAAGLDESNLLQARAFLGNQTLGYKFALCERDITIYSTIFIFGIVFACFRKNIKPINWKWWVLLGVLPIALDGGSQLISQSGLQLFSWLPVRESTPFLRMLTGGLFGLMTAWYAYTLLEQTLHVDQEIFRKPEVDSSASDPELDP